MKLKFKVQAYQTAAVKAVVDCFAGQPKREGPAYRIDPGRQVQSRAFEDEGFKNADLMIPEAQILANIQAVQKEQNLPVSAALVARAGCRINLDIEMETGTGKTYCYIKTIFELNQLYGWSKFIIMVPSVAIREGVHKSLEITADHFAEAYGRKARFFIYNSKRLHELESFSSDAGINVMVINTQAFAAKGQDNRRIHLELDDFQSRRPIDVIAANRPILILDEPQKMEGDVTTKALGDFKPLMVLGYSATHKTSYNRVHRLDALEAYNQKLVKKIAVRGISPRGQAGTHAYLYLEGIDISPSKPPVARVEMEIKQATGIKRQTRRLSLGDDLSVTSQGLEQYAGFTVSQIDARSDTVEFTNGVVLKAGEAIGDVHEGDIRRIQIRETIRAHLDKEQQLFAQGIKVLSLFFIDEVAKYRDYAAADTKGTYARLFEEEYEQLRGERLEALDLTQDGYPAFLKRDAASQVHEGYFSVDKHKKLVDPSIKATGPDKGLSDDVDAYDLILKNKERLLSQSEPVRFIFSHSALREGWDNPNVFVMCMLKHSDNTISRRQEVGRGLRLCVNQNGDRMDHPATVHDINVLTVVASESYKDFVAGLQSEIAATITSRPRKADEAFFKGKLLQTEDGPVEVTATMAKTLEFYLIQNGYVDFERAVTEAYHEAKSAETRAALPAPLQPYAEQVFALVDMVFSEGGLPPVDDGRKPKPNRLNANFEKKAFQALWARINHKAVYRVAFASDDLVAASIAALNNQLRVTPLQYVVEGGTQIDEVTDAQLRGGDTFRLSETRTERGETAHSSVRYDLLGKIAEAANLTRATVARILSGIETAVFDQFSLNPEQFIAETVRLISEQKAMSVVEHLSYDRIDDRHQVSIFDAKPVSLDLTRNGEVLKNHIYDYAVTDSDTERQFVQQLDASKDVSVYAKLPKGFFIPTPVGDYNPDWAIAFEEGSVKHIYFVAETKSTMSTMKLRAEEAIKIDCAIKFFAALAAHATRNHVVYHKVDSYGTLMDIVGR